MEKKMENQEAKLTYPREWEFTLLGKDKGEIEEAIKEVLKDKEHTFKFSNVSKSGKFNSYRAKCRVETEEERDELYKNFWNHKSISYII
jgi:putative lipoic acid-binding regulatory protein